MMRYTQGKCVHPASRGWVAGDGETGGARCAGFAGCASSRADVTAFGNTDPLNDIFDSGMISGDATIGVFGFGEVFIDSSDFPNEPNVLTVSGDMILGDGESAVGLVTVQGFDLNFNGAPSQLIVEGEFRAGNFGAGLIDVSASGVITLNGRAFFAYDPVSSVAVSVSGSGSLLDHDGASSAFTDSDWKSGDGGHYDRERRTL